MIVSIYLPDFSKNIVIEAGSMSYLEISKKIQCKKYWAVGRDFIDFVENEYTKIRADYQRFEETRFAKRKINPDDKWDDTEDLNEIEFIAESNVIIYNWDFEMLLNED